MGIWIGVGLIFTAALLVGLQFLHTKTERVNRKLYKAHVIVAVLVHTLGTIICVLTVDVQGIWLIIYSIVMLGAMVFLWYTQREAYVSAMDLQDSRDRLDKMMKGDYL